MIQKHLLVICLRLSEESNSVIQSIEWCMVASKLPLMHVQCIAPSKICHTEVSSCSADLKA